MNLQHLGGSKLDWLKTENIKPYIFVREDMRVKSPGSRFNIDWFKEEPLLFNPLQMDQVEFANQILNMETRAFKNSGMAMPRWVFYDCAIMPGFVAGFAYKTKALPMELQVALGGLSELEWTPISLFIIIPTMHEGEWFAHNLSSVNSLLPESSRFYGLGFLTKCFGLWYANIETCAGATQWNSPALALHTQYGAFEVLTSYTPVHDYSNTITYRLNVDPFYWQGFFLKDQKGTFHDLYTSAGFSVIPTDEASIKSLQKKLENHEGPFFLSGQELRTKKRTEPMTVFKPK